MKDARRGVTLLELLVTLVVLAAITSVTTLGVRRIQRPSVADPAAIVGESLKVAIAQDREIAFSIVVGDSSARVTVHPDGSADADTIIHIDGLTGRRTDAP